MVWSGQRRTVRVCPLKKLRIDNPDFFLFLLLLLPIFNLEIWSELSATPLFRIENRAVTRLFSLHVVKLFLPLSAPIGDPSALPPPCSIWKHTFISTVSIFAAAAAASACRAASACLHGHTASEGRPPSDISPVDLWKLGCNEGWTFLVARRGKAGTRCMKLT